MSAEPKPCKAPFAYYGGKAGMARRIIDLMPEHRVYIEPFFGSGAVFFAKQPARFEIINDLDDAVVTFLRVLRDRTDELEYVCSLSPHARAEFDLCAALDDPSLDDLERARRFWVRVNQSFAKTVGGHTGWSITTARTVSVAATALSRIGRFAPAASRLMWAAVECCPAWELVDRLATPDSLIYVDPPYLGETRVGRTNRATPYTDYRVDMPTEAEHRALAESLHATPAKVILSGYPSALYDELYGDWHRIDIAVHVHSSNAVTVERGKRTEVLWLNYEPHHGRLDFGGAS